jgi:hypothetical protein
MVENRVPDVTQLPDEKLDDADPVQSVFAPILGTPAWCVQKGQGSMLTFEFGNPSLYVREPIEPSPVTAEKVAARLRRRNVRPIGEWTLWIYFCNWRCFARGKIIAHSESIDKRIAAAAYELNGQRLLAVSVDPDTGTSSFVFDLGARLETSPYGGEASDQQWSLNRLSGGVFAYRADGRYSWSTSDTRPDDEIWLPLPRTSA